VFPASAGCLTIQEGGCGGSEENECEPETVPSFVEVHAAFQTVKSFFYTYNTGESNENNQLKFNFWCGGGGGVTSDLQIDIKINCFIYYFYIRK
jgi:hypothetical protein